MNIKTIFHLASYLQYPSMILVIYFSIRPYLVEVETDAEQLSLVLESINRMLIFLGIGISFATLQDTKKLSVRFEKSIWENPKRGKRFIVIMSVVTLFLLMFGIFGYFVTQNENISEVSFGVIILGISFLGFLKTAIEVFENHRKDKQPAHENQAK